MRISKYFLSNLFCIALGMHLNSIYGNEDGFDYYRECYNPSKYFEYRDFLYRDYCWDTVAPESDCEFVREQHLPGIWFPESPPLFRPFIADPLQVTYSCGWRFNDHVLARHVIDVSYGDTFGIYRWCNIWFFNGDLEVDIEGALWAVFDPLHQESPLINANYYVGFPIMYAFGNWAWRLRLYHISTHIGDEFLLLHKHFHRKNPSAQYFDAFVSYQITNDIRLYGGVGWICMQDKSFCYGDWYIETGLELRLHELGYRDYCNRLYGTPIYGMHFRLLQYFKHHIDATYVLGYEWGKVSGLRRKVRIFLEYHDGYSVEGQFCKKATNYLSIRASYGF